MLADGLLERFPCDALFGMHNRPSLAVGRFAVRAGPMMAGGAFFDIRVSGKGAHGARPETGIDAALIAGFDLRESLRTRRAVVLVLLYVLIATTASGMSNHHSASAEPRPSAVATGEIGRAHV